MNVWDYIDRRGSDECWPWTGYVDKDGYGRYCPSVNGKQLHVRAPRAVYAELVSPIEDGLQIDHLCRNRACVNPAHLECVTQTENVRRGFLARGYDGTCSKGHPLDYHCGNGKRYCRTCHRENDRAYRARRKQATMDLKKLRP